MSLIVGAVLLVTGCASADVSPTPAPTDATVAPSAAATVSPAVTQASSPTAVASVPEISPPTPTATASDDVPRPVGDTWVKAGTLDKGRSVTKLALLPATGEVMAVGDDVACGLESSTSDTTELYDPVANRWQAGARMPSARHGPAVATLDDGVLVTGGSTQEYVAKSGTVVYDPDMGTWSRSGLLNTARIDPAIAELSAGRVLIAGGLLINESQTGGALDTAEIWDPDPGVWNRTATMSGARYGPVAVTLDDGRALVVGGLPTWGAEDQRRSAELFDPATGHWRSAGALAETPRWISLVPSLGGALAVYAPAGGSAIRAEWFDPDQLGWSSAGDPGMRIGEGRATAVTLRDDRVLVISGDDTRIFEPGGAWMQARSIPDGPRNDASAVLLPDGSVLVAGGWTIGTEPGETGGCESPNPQAWRYIPTAEDAE